MVINDKQKIKIIAIDGPAGAGKSTVAKKLAGELRILYVDTGAMYRAVTLKALKEKVSFDDEAALTALARKADIQLGMENGLVRVILDGEDVSLAIRQPRLTEKVRFVAGVPGVRLEMVKMQRSLARKAGRAVLDGRDIGTVVFPDAEYKFYLDAKVSERSRRRFKELKQMGEDVVEENISADIKKRDESDMTRTVAPLVKADDAVYIDTTDLTVQDVLDKILSVVNRI